MAEAFAIFVVSLRALVWWESGRAAIDSANEMSEKLLGSSPFSLPTSPANAAQRSARTYTAKHDRLTIQSEWIERNSCNVYHNCGDADFAE